MTIHNNTHYNIKTIKEFKKLAHCTNNWRKRYIDLYQHPTKPYSVISIGYSFDNKTIVIAEELKCQHTDTLNGMTEIF